jgi:hypothetical protein
MLLAIHDNGKVVAPVFLPLLLRLLLRLLLSECLRRGQEEQNNEPCECPVHDATLLTVLVLAHEPISSRVRSTSAASL